MKSKVNEIEQIVEDEQYERAFQRWHLERLPKELQELYMGELLWKKKK